MDFLMTPEFFSLVILPLLIFLARIADVTMGTIRIIFISRGIRLLAPLVGFFEVLIWLLAITQIMQNLTNIVNYVAYAAGFAAGTYIGMYIENRISLGILAVRIIARKEAPKLIDVLSSSGYRITTVEASGTYGPVRIIYTIVKRKNLRKLIGVVKKTNPNALYSVEDVRLARDEVKIAAQAGVHTKSHFRKRMNRFRLHRKGK
jgi:uncharacterized protein YebE (UPF0316 family)